MPKTDSKAYRLWELEKRISVLKWDIPLIHNTQLRSQKEKELEECKRELDSLIMLQTKLGGKKNGEEESINNKEEST